MAAMSLPTAAMVRQRKAAAHNPTDLFAESNQNGFIARQRRETAPDAPACDGQVSVSVIAGMAVNGATANTDKVSTRAGDLLRDGSLPAASAALQAVPHRDAPVPMDDTPLSLTAAPSMPQASLHGT